LSFMTHMTCIYFFGHLQTRVEEKKYFVIQKKWKVDGNNAKPVLLV
jgi:hypothetical protein